MSSYPETKRSWKEVFSAWSHPRVVTMLFLGFSAGLPILLIFSTLGLWLREAGFSRSTVTFFSWAALAYSFKFIWAPLIDIIPLPYLSAKLGRRRGWMIASQLMVIVSICSMASIDPSTGGSAVAAMALATVLLGFSSATQDIVIDAYRIECIEESYQALLSSAYITGYRIGMMVAGAGALYLASYLGTTTDHYLYSAWRTTYFVMALTMIIGVLTTLSIPEPEQNMSDGVFKYAHSDYARLFFVFICGALGFSATFFFSTELVSKIKATFELYTINPGLAGFVVESLRLVVAVVNGAGIFFFLVKIKTVDGELVREAYIEPLLDFVRRYHWYIVILLLLLIGFYRISDIVLGVISTIFYADMGYSKNVIASITKFYGLGMTIIGTFIGGILTLRYGVYAILFLGALLSAATNIFFVVLAESGTNIALLTGVIAIDNLSAGLASVAFVAFLSSLTSVSFTATQYALFSSLMTLFPKLIGGYSGTIVDAVGYHTFFFITATIGAPVLLLIFLLVKALKNDSTP